MRKALAIVSAVVLTATTPSVAIIGAAHHPEESLADLYRFGRFVMRADEDWTSRLPSDLFFESRGDIAVAPDGSVFVSNTPRHPQQRSDRVRHQVRPLGAHGGSGPSGSLRTSRQTPDSELTVSNCVQYRCRALSEDVPPLG